MAEQALQQQKLDFSQFKELMQLHVAEMVKDQNILFVVDVDKDTLWDTYLESFPEGTNLIFRERREFDCSCCRQFIKSFGNVVRINSDNSVTTIWDFRTDDNTFQPVLDAMSNLIKSAPVRDVFVAKETGFGTDRNREQLENGEVITWEHFRIDLPKRFKFTSNETIGSLLGNYRENKNVFKRSLEEINTEAVETVLELIGQKSLYKGEEWKSVLEKFLSLQKEYNKLRSGQENYCWRKSVEVGPVISKIRNHSIGVLLQDLSEGVELDEAVRRYEKVVAPSNYKRPKAIFTKKMVEDAQKQVKELSLENSLGRRHATLEDITVNNILFANKDARNKIQGDPFMELQQEVAVNPKKFNKTEEVPIETFVSEILPYTTNIELLFENNHASNLMSLIAPQDKNAPTLFKWNNDGENNNDFDAHCIEPHGNEIFFENKRRRHPSSGMLDVDITQPQNQCPGKPAVENIIYTTSDKMPEGIYHFFVHNYAHNGGRTGFSAEIEFNGQIYQFEYPKELRQKENVTVAKVRFSKDKGFEIVESMPSSVQTKEVWGLNTNQFYPVSVFMFSPNYWDGQDGIGHKHYFFMIDGCKNPDNPNGFFNEFLREDLMKYKRVFEALGSKMRVEYSDNQLSGLGFSSTKRNSLICKVEGNISRTIKLTV